MLSGNREHFIKNLLCLQKSIARMEDKVASFKRRRKRGKGEIG